MKDGNYVILDGDVAHGVGEIFAHRATEDQPPGDVKAQLERRAETLGITAPKFIAVEKYLKTAKAKKIKGNIGRTAIRSERNTRLRNTDYTQIPDAAARIKAGTPEQWAAYRQSVHDIAKAAITDGTPVDSIEWPNEPG